MLDKRIISVLLVAAISIISCSSNIKSSFTGLWLVEKVEAGGETMTPVARWMRFYDDNTQQSGNGWYQHSVGIYKLDLSRQTLAVTNTNGYMDPYEPFHIDLSGDSMVWTREEEGTEVVITLRKIERIPSSPGDKLLGVWDFESITEGGEDFTSKYDPDKRRYLYLRWDRMFTARNAPGGRKDGIYKIHAHKPEIELVYYSDDCKREYWDFSFSDEMLILKSVNEPIEKIIKFSRINYFPE